MLRWSKKSKSLNTLLLAAGLGLAGVQPLFTEAFAIEALDTDERSDVVVSVRIDGLPRDFLLSSEQVEGSAVMAAALLSGESVLDLGDVKGEAFGLIIDHLQGKELDLDKVASLADLIYEQNRWDVPGLARQLRKHIKHEDFLDKASVAELVGIMLAVNPMTSVDWKEAGAKVRDELVVRQFVDSAVAAEVVKLLAKDPEAAKRYASYAENPPVGVLQAVIARREQIAAEREQRAFKKRVEAIDAEVMQACRKAAKNGGSNIYIKRFVPEDDAYKIVRELKRLHPEFSVSKSRCRILGMRFDRYDIEVDFSHR